MAQPSQDPENRRYQGSYYPREHQYSERRGDSNIHRDDYPRSKAYMTSQSRDSDRSYRPHRNQEKARHSRLQWRPHTEVSVQKTGEPPQNIAQPRMEEASSSPLLQNPPVRGVPLRSDQPFDNQTGMEEAIGEVREAMIQYTMCADPTESVARKKDYAKLKNRER
ncbi:hypothetical protein DY000_02037812 [Brassica cretica]|uniref:Uncharacterized protein n=1 Tax=Brassica cretica TaxID=69181 RepID=A0ABQ7BF21_BRACR|nr:hypothetical protein DY000_02037812 [Brassica cretica]